MADSRTETEKPVALRIILIAFAIIDWTISLAAAAVLVVIFVAVHPEEPVTGGLEGVACCFAIALVCRLLGRHLIKRWTGAGDGI